MTKIQYSLIFVFALLLLVHNPVSAFSPVSPPMCQVYGVIIRTNFLSLYTNDDVDVLILLSRYTHNNDQDTHQNTLFEGCETLYPTGKIITTSLSYKIMREKNGLKKYFSAYPGKFVLFNGFYGDLNQIPDTTDVRTTNLLIVINILILIFIVFLAFFVIRFLLRKRKMVFLKRLPRVKN